MDNCKKNEDCFVMINALFLQIACIVTITG